MVAVAMRDDNEVEPPEIDPERPHVEGEDVGVIPGVEENAFAPLLDEGGKTPSRG